MQKLKCPNGCPSPLVLESYEGVEVDRCPDCHGVWLDQDEIFEIIENREERFAQNSVQDALKNRKMGVPKEEIANKKLCPHCLVELKPVNYAVDSGVIIDNCPKGHGLWFDNGELEKVQMIQENLQDLAKEKEAEWMQIAKSAPKRQRPYKNTMSPFKALINLFFD